MSGRRGRPTGSTSYCSYCGESGHNSRGASCSAVAIAERLVLVDGIQQSEAARMAGCSPQALSNRLLRRSAP